MKVLKPKSVLEMYFCANRKKLNLWEKLALDKSAWIKACVYIYNIYTYYYTYIHIYIQYISIHIQYKHTQALSGDFQHACSKMHA